jgi:hypothetical protein
VVFKVQEILISRDGVHAGCVLLWLDNQRGGSVSGFLPLPPALPNFWSALNTLPLILGVLLGRNVHQPSDFGVYVGFFLQWFIVGYLLSVLVFAYIDWGKQKKSNTN